MTVSVIICTCNRYELICDTINSICNNSIKPFELIIVDQSDNMDHMNLILKDLNRKYKNIVIQHDNGKGLSRARNLGGRLATGVILAYTDDDAYVDKDWIKSIIDVFKDKNYRTGITGGKIIPVYYEKESEWEMPKQWQYLLPAYDRGDYYGRYENGDLPPGVNYATLKSLFETIGGFNEKLGVNAGKKFQIFGEDSEFSLKVKDLGYDLIYNYKNIVYHPVPLSRQSQNFLNKRLFTEGRTQIFIHFNLNKTKKINMIKLLFRKIIALLKYILSNHSNTELTVFTGRKFFLYGEISMLLNWILYQHKMLSFYKPIN